jgi:uncharacterized membrane protein
VTPRALGPFVALGVAALVVYLVLALTLTDMYAAKAVVGAVIVGVLTFVASLIGTALVIASRGDDWKRG